MITIPSFFAERNSLVPFLHYLEKTTIKRLLNLPYDKTTTVWIKFETLVTSYLKLEQATLLVQRNFRRCYDRESLYFRYHTKHKINPSKSEPLYIKRVTNPQELEDFKLQLERWENCSFLKSYQPNEMPKNVALGLDFSQMTRVTIDSFAYEEKNFLFYVVDGKNNMQAFSKLHMFVRSARLKIALIVSAPTNNDTHRQAERISGAACALIEYACFWMIQNNRERLQRSTLFLQPENTSLLPFYKRLHFKSNDSEWHQCELTGPDLRKFLKEFGGRAKCLSLPSFFTHVKCVYPFLSYLGLYEVTALLNLSPFAMESSTWRTFRVLAHHYLNSYFSFHAGVQATFSSPTLPYNPKNLFYAYHTRNKDNPSKSFPLFVREVRNPTEHRLFLEQSREWQNRATSIWGSNENMPERVLLGLRLTQLMQQNKETACTCFYIVDAREDMQAYALMEVNKPHPGIAVVYHLVSAPTNNGISNTNERVSGAASALIEQIIFLMLHKNGAQHPVQIELGALADSLPYFERLHFKQKSPNSLEFRLAAQDIVSFLNQFGGRAILADS